jgi:hypothetical protein
MTIPLLLRVASVVAFVPLLAAQRPAQSGPSAARAEDVQSIDAIVASLYDVISGPAKQARNWDRMRSLFVPGARLIPTGLSGTGASARVLDVDAYIERVTPVFERDGFYEREIARKIDQFGNIAQLFSTYESRHTPDDPAPFARGINSIQLLRDGSRWWVVTVYWDAERPGNPIPPQYLR